MRSRSQRSKPSSQIFGNHWIEELAAGDLRGGDETSDTRAAPRRDDLDVEPRLRPLLTVGRALVQPHHVRQRLPVQAVEPIEDVDQHRRQGLTSFVVERRQVGYLFQWSERQRDGERRRLRHAGRPARRLWCRRRRRGDEPLTAVGLRLPPGVQQRGGSLRHVVVGVDLTVRMGDGRADLRATILEDEHEVDVVAPAERGGAVGPQIDDLANSGHTE